MRNWNRSISFALIAVGVLSLSARAETVTMTLTGLDPMVSGDMFLANYGTVTNGGVGNFQWQGVASNPAPFQGSFDSYCIDLIEFNTFGSTYTYTEEPIVSAPKSAAFPGGTPTTGMAMTKADEMEALFGVDFSKTLPAGNSVDREAFQLAMWNILYDTDASVSQGSGTFYVDNNTGISPTAITLANGFLSDALNPTNQSLDATNLVALVGSAGAQDQITMIPVPIPAPGKAAAVMMVGFFLYTLRRSRRRLKDDGCF